MTVWGFVCRAVVLFIVLRFPQTIVYGQGPSSLGIPEEELHPGVTGVVYDGTRAILPGVLVRLRGIDPPQVERTVRTNQQGVYFVGCLEDGLYELSFSQEGYFEALVRFNYFYPMDLSIDQILSLAIGRPPNTINFSVVDGLTGLPIENASVEVEGFGPPLPTDRCGRTWGARLGKNNITVRKEGYKTERREIALGRNQRINLRFELKPKQ